jgi:hypothetical protein
MAEQMRHLCSVSELPNVTMTVMPAEAHPANASELIVTDSAAYVEHLTGGLVHVDAETVSRLDRLFTTIASDSYRASDSIELITEVGDVWTGASQATANRTGDRV